MTPRTAPRTLTFMNNKGGVGKTTLACNMAYYLANNHRLNVLVVDLDPQCNATQLLLEEDTWVEILSDDEAHADSRSILYPLANIRQGDSSVQTDIKPVRSPRFQVDVLTGHPRLSLVEDTLSTAWENMQASNLGGARRTNWIHHLMDGLDSSYDLIVMDVGPSLGALNRTVLIGSDYVLTPTSADLFSLYALENIAKWAKTWGKRYNSAIERILEDFGAEAEQYGLSDPESSRSASYLGYTIQQYVSKSSADGKRRGVKSHDFYREQIPARAIQLVESLDPQRLTSDLDLGTVPHMFSMVPLAQSRHAPISALEYADGLRGAQISQQEKYRAQLNDIGDRLYRALIGAGYPAKGEI